MAEKDIGILKEVQEIRQFEDRSIKWKFSNTVKEGWRLSELSGRYDENADDLVQLRKKLTHIATELTATCGAIPVKETE